jgi:hypothetical protein
MIGFQRLGVGIKLVFCCERTQIMMRIAFIVAAGLALSTGMVSAKSLHHHGHRPGRAVAVVPAPAPYMGGTLVLHPAWNIACMTRDRATRALPCDQPVWVYGSPCEIDLGLGRYRSCD